MRLAVALLLLLLAAVPARAQGGATVARHGEVRLLVRDDREREIPRGLCVSVRTSRSGSSGTCGTAPTSRMSAMLVGVPDGSRTFVGGAVPAGTVEVELEFARGEKVRARTVAGGPYTGRHSGKVVFFLAETTGAQRQPDNEDRFADEDEPVLIRRFDAGGNLVGAASGDRFGGATVAGPQGLTRARGMLVTASASRTFAPSVLKLDRTQNYVCLHFEHDRGRSHGQCTGPGPALPLLDVYPLRECGRGTFVQGFVAPHVAAVEVVLGDGHRKRARTLDVSGLGTSARAVAIAVAPGTAVRSARALDAAGRTLESHALRAAPAARRCASGSSGIIAFGSTTISPASSGATGEVVAGAAPGPRLVARDEGEDVCMGIDDFGGDHHGCELPPPEADVPRVITRRTATYSAAAGLVPPGAHRVRVVFEGGRRVEAAISEGGAYSGMYRGHVRFFLASAGPGRDITAVETFDAAGKLLSSLPTGEGSGPPRTFARGPGYRLHGSRFDHRFKFPGQRAERSRGSCFGLAFGRRPADPDSCMPLQGGTVFGEVSCSPRGGVLVGRMTKGLLGARFELAGGGAVDARIVRVPARLGGGRLWVLEIPPSARVARLRLLGTLPKRRFAPIGQPRVRPFALPAPRRQCGYALDVTF